MLARCFVITRLNTFTVDCWTSIDSRLLNLLIRRPRKVRESNYTTKPDTPLIVRPKRVATLGRFGLEKQPISLACVLETTSFSLTKLHVTLSESNADLHMLTTTVLKAELRMERYVQ